MMYSAKETVKNTMARYPIGTIVKMRFMDDPSAVPVGTLGVVRLVDDMGTVHTIWENGRRLGFIPGVDSVEIIKKGGE